MQLTGPLGGGWAEEVGCGWWILSWVPLVPQAFWPGSRISPGFVSAQWEGSLSELWVWSRVAYSKVKPSTVHPALLGFSWLWCDQCSDLALAP